MSKYPYTSLNIPVFLRNMDSKAFFKALWLSLFEQLVVTYHKYHDYCDDDKLVIFLISKHHLLQIAPIRSS